MLLVIPVCSEIFLMNAGVGAELVQQGDAVSRRIAVECA